MIRIDHASTEDVRLVASQMRERDVTEFLATSFATTREELASELTSRFTVLGGAICASDDAGPVAIGATIEARPNVLTLSFFANDRFPEIAIELTSFIRQRLFPAQRRAGAHRIECVSIDTYTDAHRWIEILGLTQESVLPGYGRGGETFLQFAWVADHVR